MQELAKRAFPITKFKEGVLESAITQLYLLCEVAVESSHCFEFTEVSLLYPGCSQLMADRMRACP